MEELFKLAVDIQKNFNDFYLAEATAIMFKFNHRRSIDLF